MVDESETRMVEEGKVAAVEEHLYSRMWWNGLKGFARSAAIGAVAGVIIGALVACAVSAGILPALPYVGTVFATSLQWGAAFAAAIGSFGAIAGINATRDTRRYLLIHESPELQKKEKQVEKVNALNFSQQTAHREDSKHFREMLDKQPPDKPQLEIG